MQKHYDVEFRVIWDQLRKAFAIERDSVPTGRFFAVRANAIEVATQAAQFENRDGRTAVVFRVGEDRKRVVE